MLLNTIFPVLFAVFTESIPERSIQAQTGQNYLIEERDYKYLKTIQIDESANSRKANVKEMLPQKKENLEDEIPKSFNESMIICFRYTIM